VSPRVARKVAPDLSREKIADAALHLIDRDGLEAFSTRKLGAALGCEAMAIYWYYPSKDALLDAIVDLLIAPVAATLDGDDWIETLRRVAHAYRAIAIDHPHAFPLLATRRFASEASYAFLDALFSRARTAGIGDRDAARFFRAVSSYCNGFALNELAAASTDKRSKLHRKFERVAAVNAHLDPEKLDGVFEFGLELFLDELRTRSTSRA
jgi:AcrR family transcriptional regulator